MAYTLRLASTSEGGVRARETVDGMSSRPTAINNWGGFGAADANGYAIRNGIDKVAQVGIAGRGLLLDIARMVTGTDGGMLEPEFSINEDVVRACIDEQGVAVEPGDVICFRTGWTERYLA